MSEYVYGIHPLEDLFASQGRSIERVWVQRGTRNPSLLKIVQKARKESIEICFEERKYMDRLVHGVRHQGVIALCGKKATLLLEDLLEIPGKNGEPPLFLVLDCVQDQGNLGAVIRTAAAAGVHGMILPKRGTAPLGPVAFKRSAGALERVPVALVTNLVRVLEALKKRGIWIIGASSGAGTAYTSPDLSGPTALVIGGENGIRRLVREHCDLMVSIPMAEGSESLNLSAAAALLIYEVLRDRKNLRK